MSWSTRFIEKKSQDGWQTVGSGRRPEAAAGGGGGGGGWGRRPEAAGGSWKKSEAPKPATVELDSEEQFPSLGGKKKVSATVQPKANSGFATLASAWAQQDSAERAAAEAARVASEKAAAIRARDVGLMEHVFSRLNRPQMATVSMEEEQSYDDLDCDGYGRREPRSPPYDPDPAYEPMAEEEAEDNWTMKE